MPCLQSLVHVSGMSILADYKPVALAGAVLAIAASLGTGLLSLTASHAGPYIAINKHNALLDNLKAVIPPDSFNNDIAADTLAISEAGKGALAGQTQVYRAREDGVPVAVAFEWTAHGGYNGDIVLLMGVSVNGDVTGVRVIEHHETPGLGDAIDSRRSGWIERFRGRSLSNPDASGWHVKKDGGEFDQFTGATITPRAVVAGVRQGLQFFHEHRDELFPVTQPTSQQQEE